jgi:hypothetical protein
LSILFGEFDSLTFLEVGKKTPNPPVMPCSFFCEKYPVFEEFFAFIESGSGQNLDAIPELLALLLP